MLLNPSPDQELLRETTERYLAETVPPATLRRLRDDPAGYEGDYWRQGTELGWTSLLVSEDNGGGSVSGNGLVDLSLVAHEFGRHAAPGPLAATNVVASTLSEHGAHPEVLSGILNGTTIATWCAPQLVPEPGSWRPTVEIAHRGSEVVVRGEVRQVESALQSEHLLVTGTDGDGLSQVLVPAATDGVERQPMGSLDLSRRFGVVAFGDVRLPAAAVVGVAGAAEPDVARQYCQMLAILNAEAVGAMQAAFDMTTTWAFDRYTFGRPLASYQALKHRFADMLTWLEASHAVSDAACRAVGAGGPDAEEWASVAKAYIGQYGAEVVHECVQLHGGIGVTFEHDLHLYVRRFSVNRALAGTPSEHRRRIGAMVARGGVAA